jgi:hypothetical protein
VAEDDHVEPGDFVGEPVAQVLVRRVADARTAIASARRRVPLESRVHERDHRLAALGSAQSRDLAARHLQRVQEPEAAVERRIHELRHGRRGEPDDADAHALHFAHHRRAEGGLARARVHHIGSQEREPRAGRRRSPARRRPASNSWLPIASAS